MVFLKNSFLGILLFGALIGVSGVKFKPDLVHDLEEFKTLISMKTVEELIGKHLIIDKPFRHAVEFLKSKELEPLVNQILDTPEVISFLNYLNLLEENTTAIYSNLEQTTEFNVEYMVFDAGQEYPRNYKVVLVSSFNNDLRTMVMYEPHRKFESFESFIREVLDHLPRDRFKEMITLKRKNNTDFEQFYQALRSDKLKNMVSTLLASQNLKSFIAKFADHCIDVKCLVPIAFEVISWGPPVRKIARRKIHGKKGLLN